MDSLRLFVKQKRKELKLTQEGLALNVGVGLRFVRDLEQGKKTLRLDKCYFRSSMDLSLSASF